MPVSLSNPTLSPNSPAATVLGWLKQAMGLPTAELHIKLRGNILHVLCETPEALDQSAVLLKLVRSLIEGGDDLVRQHYPQVYQLYVYSRLEGNPTPEWTAPIYLNRLERHLAQLVLENQDEADIKATHSLLEKYNQGQSARGVEGGSGAIVLSNLSLARKGDPEAIAWYLSETLSSLDVGVWVSIKAIPGTAHLHRMAIPVGLASRIAGDNGDAAADDPAGTDTTISRLWILCEATYSPDPSLIARPTAERLRQLQLTQFKDAVLLLQVRGETKPDWSLRIDLTPPEEMLREWGRWGDTDAIARLLSAAVASWHLGVTAELTNGTLHLICSPQSGDHDTQQAEGLAAQEAVLEALTTPLNDLAPQGIPRAVIYGQAGANATPAWVHYLDLPAAEHSALADTPEYLGQTGDLPAIAFLLTRLLNPSLDDRLATGGQRVQLLRRDGLLHVMVDGPVAPRRRLVAPPINDYLLALSPMGIEGVRIYGRRSGQSQPAWTFGQDFLARRRLVPEATPEFTASDSYVNELLVRPDGPVTTAELEAELEEDVALSQWVQDVLTQGRHLLLRSQLLTSATSENLGDGVESLDNLGRSDGFKIAVVWAAVGVLVALQVDWLLGQIITPPSQQAKAEDIAPSLAEPAEPSDPLVEDLAELDWPGSQSSDNGWGEGGFTSDSNGDAAGAESLDTSPSQPIVAIDDLVEQASFSSFNSDQMNEKLALYYQRLEQSGPPDVMIVGSSRALRGVDPVALRQELATIGYDNVSIFNFGINGATAQVVDLVIRQVLEPDQLPQLIIWADGARAFNSGRVDATYNAIAASPGYREVANRRAEEVEAVASPGDPTAPGSPETSTGSLPKSYAAMDEWLSGRLATVSAVYADRDRLKGWFQQRLMVATPTPPGSSEEGLDAAMPEGSTIDFDGFLALSVRFNPATYYQDFARVSGRYDGDYDSFRLEGQQVEAFANLLSFTQEQDIPIVFINTPLTDEYLDDYRRDAEAEFLQHMLKLSTTETGFLFRDFAQLWPDRYDYFSDPSHLNRYGAYQVSSQLGQDPLIAWPRPAAPPAPPALP